MQLTFGGQVVFILGGTGALALEFAARAMAAGLTPVLTYRNAQGEQKITARLAERQHRYRTLDLDLARPQPAQALAPLRHSPDYLVDFAQGDLENLVAAADDNTAASYFKINISGRFMVVKAIARLMLQKRKGRMVFVSSAAAARPNPGQGFYAAAKSASEALYRNLGLELGERGITTVTLRPGYIAAGRGQQFIDNHQELIKDKIPIQRALTAREVADTLLFLLSDCAQGFNATALTLDGGMSAGK